MNRPGMRGFRKKTPKKDANDDDAENGDEPATPIPTKGKKRTKKEADGENETPK